MEPTLNHAVVTPVGRTSVLSAPHRVRDRRMYIALAVVAFFVIEVNLPDLGSRRLAYPAFLLLICLLLPFLVSQTLRLSVAQVPRLVAGSSLLFIAWCAVSSAWSMHPQETIFHLAIIGVTILVTVSFLEVDARQTYNVVLAITLSIMLLSWLALFTAPSIALQESQFWRLRGIMAHEMRLAYVAAIALIILSVSILSSWRHKTGIARAFFILCVVLSLSSLVATATRTILVYTLACIAMMAFLSVRSTGKLLVLALLGCFAVLGWFYWGDIITAFSRGDADETLTGRTTIWEWTMDLAGRRSTTGYGFASFYFPEFDTFWGAYRPPVAHNVWIQAYFEIGTLGVILLTFWLGAMLLTAWRVQERIGRPSAAFYVLLFATLGGLTGSGFGSRLQSVVGIGLLLLAVEVGEARRRRRVRRSLATPPVAATPDPPRFAACNYEGQSGRLHPPLNSAHLQVSGPQG